MEVFKITDRLKNLRESRGIKSEEIAKLLHITPAAYNKFETGETEVTYKKLQEIAKVYNMSVHDIFNPNPKAEINQTNNQSDQNQANENKGIININDYNNTQNNISDREKELYQNHIKQLQEENKFLKELIESLKRK